MKSKQIVGIDLGTTFSAIACINQYGKAEILPNREGERITPSVVLFDGDMPIVGTIAKRSAAASPLNVCQFVKRQMGEKDWRFSTNDDEDYTAEEISALILRRMKDDAQTALNSEVVDAVITVPAYFNDAQRKATQDAGRIAGLNVLRIVNEPTAAALAYGLNTSEEQTILVYDLGGGTFDVTIMRVSMEEIDVLATGGDKNLGGFDWDNRVMNFLNEEFQKADGADLLDDPALTQDLRDKSEIAKKTLSSRDSTKVFLSAEGKNASISITRDDFERITGDLLDRTESLMEMTLEDARLEWVDINKVLLVGGSTRMKAVCAMVERVSGKKPSVELHPDEVVAAGAALLGGILQKGAGCGDAKHLAELPSVRVSDVNSHSLGVIAVDGHTGKPYSSIVLPKDTKVCTRMSETYQTLSDNQTELKIEVTQGEEQDLEYTTIIGGGTIRIPAYPRGAPVAVSFEYNDDGLIRVTVLDMTANKQLGELQIEREANRTQAEVARMQRRISSVEIQ